MAPPMRRRCSISSRPAQPSASSSTSAVHPQADGLRVRQQADRLEQHDPVVAAGLTGAAIEQGQLRPQRVVHIGRDIEQRHAQQPQAQRRAEGIAVAPQKGHDDQRRHQQLHQRAAQHPQPCAEDAPDQVSGLMEQQQRAMQERRGDLAVARVGGDQRPAPHGRSGEHGGVQPPAPCFDALGHVQQPLRQRARCAARRVLHAARCA